nr:MAG TPA: hypothetical protein [Caudoviricetes sp.]
MPSYHPRTSTGISVDSVSISIELCKVKVSNYC